MTFEQMCANELVSGSFIGEEFHDMGMAAFRVVIVQPDLGTHTGVFEGGEQFAAEVFPS